MTEGLITLVDLNPQFDHTAHAVPNLRDVLPLYHDLLGGRLILGADNERTGFRVLQLRMPDGTKFELIEPLAGSSFLDSFFERTAGRGGLHHVTFTVDSVDDATSRLKTAALRVLGYFEGDADLPAQVFIHPTSASGALVQLVQRGFTPPTTTTDLQEILAGRGSVAPANRVADGPDDKRTPLS